MTSPRPQAPPTQQTAAETSAMIPVLLSVMGAYLASKPAVSGSWESVAANMGLADLAGNALTNVAERSLDRLYRENGTAVKKFEPHKAEAIQEGVQAGLHELVEVVKAIAPGSTESIGKGAPRTSTELTPARGTQVGRKEGGAPGDSDTLAIPASRAIPKPLRSRITPWELQWTATNLAESIGNSTTVKLAALVGWDKTWHSQQDGRVRSSHNALNGVRISSGEPFRTPEGIELRFPHDPFAPLDQVAGCRCWITVARPRKAP